MTLYTDLIEHLRQDADFNRSWTDGRRGADLITSEGYIARRLEVAKQRDDWADAITALLAENVKIKAAFRINMLRYAPQSHAEIDAFLSPPQKTET